METAQERLEREWLQVNDDRRTRGFDLRSQERKERDFVPNSYVSGVVEPEEPVETPNTFTSNFKGTF